MLPLVHLDADAFFASVEQAADRRLRKRPIAVGGGHRGIIASASYEARAYGVRTAMPTYQALDRCPDLVLVDGHYDLYEQFSDTLFDVCREQTPYVEQASIDEGYLDFRGRFGESQSVVNQMRSLDAEICGMLKISVSTGIGRNKLISQVASKLKKPHGFTVVPAGSECRFMASLPLLCLPGLGPKTAQRLQQIGLHRLKDLVEAGPNLLEPYFGIRTAAILERAQGIDERPIELEKAPAKSYGEQKSFEEDVANEAIVEGVIQDILEHLTERLRQANQQARSMELAIRYGDRETHSGSFSLREPSYLTSDFLPHLRPLLKRTWSRRVRLRQVRLKLYALYPALFQDDCFHPNRSRLRQLAHLQDKLKAQYGKAALLRASALSRHQDNSA